MGQEAPSPHFYTGFFSLIYTIEFIIKPTSNQCTDHPFLREITHTELSTDRLHRKGIASLWLQVEYCILPFRGINIVYIFIGRGDKAVLCIAVPYGKLSDVMTTITLQFIPAKSDLGALDT